MKQTQGTPLSRAERLAGRTKLATQRANRVEGFFGGMMMAATGIAMLFRGIHELSSSFVSKEEPKTEDGKATD